MDSYYIHYKNGLKSNNFKKSYKSLDDARKVIQQILNLQENQGCLSQGRKSSTEHRLEVRKIILSDDRNTLCERAQSWFLIDSFDFKYDLLKE